MRPERLERLPPRRRSRWRLERPDPHPPYRPIAPGDDPTLVAGLELIPEPDDGDVFLDFEGDPFWRPDAGLFFLFGLIARTPTAPGSTGRSGPTIWRTRPRRRVSSSKFLDRRATHPGMHVYHYNHTERSALERLAADHGVGEASWPIGRHRTLRRPVPVVRNAVQVGTESYGLKHLERLTGYQRGQRSTRVQPRSSSTRSTWSHTTTPSSIGSPPTTRTTFAPPWALRDWLVALARTTCHGGPRSRSGGGPSRARRTGRRFARLGPSTPEHLLGDLLGYWVRESAPTRRRSSRRPAARHRSCSTTRT